MADDQPRPTENDNQDADESADLRMEADEAPTADAVSEADADRERDDTSVEEASDERVATGETSDDEVAPDETADVGIAPDETSDEAVGTNESSGEEATPTDDEAASPTGDETATDEPTPDEPTPDEAAPDEATADVPKDVRKYERFKKMDGAQYDRVNEFLRERTYITAREWAIARLCADFRTETGVEMTKIGENLPELVPFMTDTYTPQAVNQARSSFEDKVRQAGATFLYGAMSGFFTAEELDDMMYEVTEVAKFLLEVEGVDLSVEEELEAEDRISGVMRDVRSASEQLRHDELECPHCGHEMEAAEAETTDTVESDD